MKLHEVRRWVHRSNGTLAILLLFTGGLVTFPDVRAALIGGWGQMLSDVHVFSGFIFVTVPLLALLWKGSDLLDNLKKRILSSNKVHWRRVHLGVALLSASIMALTGPVMWLDARFEFPVLIMDVIFFIHLTAAWVVGLSLPLHLWMARHAIARTGRKWLGFGKSASEPKATAASEMSEGNEISADEAFGRRAA